MQNCLILKFTTSESLSLFETYFLSDNPAGSRHAVRGKTSGAHFGAGTFQWTSAVQAFAVLALRSSAAATTDSASLPYVLEGFRGSIASSLDFSISKETNWLVDMFGFDCGERPLIKKLFLRSNANLKRPGPVGIAFNPSRLASKLIDISVDGVPVESAHAKLALADRISEQFELRGRGKRELSEEITSLAA